ncbi:Beta-glucan synthesis-associated protein KRE6 OS=Saccharomyces cerevisiae (strain ATCC 204508 / S288c) GN=KRE6 PE=1 SV=2 [Rhizoctonia solani AG-1 IB]|uniref:Beta-glucan synthesis-associated protein KRE6 n=2 Tax=Thanatephorus cucumeris (strain AG1-IB / isolate 7/3/14) TaxID=1108050 RepID=A0A0B7FGL9_THACB|nr:Beta-glucan synthesis-associated protein KRE6 OS=Saccharomyces cerevisiae (strain ATCC 204508 / S288c) GN=KRE6 PE=1 SV=2 [Rhizoctonia solani AG-1 IB]
MATPSTTSSSSSSSSPEPRMAPGAAAAYNPVPTSPNSPTTPLDRPMNGRGSTHVSRSSPLNPNAEIPQRRSRPPSAGSSRLQAELQDGRSSTENDARATIAHLAYSHNTLSAPLRPPSTAVNNRFSTMSSTGSILSFASDSKYPAAYHHANLSAVEYLDQGDDWAPLYEGPEEDDALHTPDPKGYREGFAWSGRGLFNVGMLLLVILALLALFISYPIVSFIQNGPVKVSTRVNSTGQVASLTRMPDLIDRDTPQSAMTRTGFDGQEYDLVFSDEFNTDGRTFNPGDDPFWEAVDLNYWATRDLEWYDPGNAITKDGNLVLTLESVLNHDLNYRSGMLQSWNKFCFTNGYIEFNLSLPGEPNVPGYWPGAWIMGNLGRPGYGGTTDGVWPYTYDSCDIGTFPNQTRKDGTPVTNASGGTKKYDYQLSVLSGQKLSACTCPDTPSSEHPGPNMSTGRGAPEIDALEAQKNKQGDGGRVSQSAQFAPFSYNYTFDESAIHVEDPSVTFLNDYRGSAVQQAVSGLTTLPDDIYQETQGNFQTFGFEYYGNKDKRSDGYITWLANGKKSLSMTAAAVGPDSMAEIQSRPVPEEPMSIVMNLAISESFQKVDVANLRFPGYFKVDYVRVYQRKGETNIGCDPKDYPTTQYIRDHLDVYTNANITKWPTAFPKNSLYDGCS